MFANRNQVPRVAMIWLLVLSAVSVARANETDQFTLPPDKEFVDLGPWITECHYRVLEKVVKKANKKIDQAAKIKNKHERELALRKAQSPGALADSIRHSFAPGFFDMMDVEAALKTKKAERNFPGKVLLWAPGNWIYLYTHLPFDPRKIPLLFPAGTIKVYDVYVGTDKFGHFHDLGHIYYKDYLSRRRGGQAEEKAIAGVISTWSRGPISEGAGIGNLATGVYSNADLAVNYLGYKFYRNMTEPVMLQGKTYPPMLVRDGERWKFNKHVGPTTDFMKPYFSDHLNEALNPCVYTADVRFGVENRIRDIAPQILAFYRDEDGKQRPKVWFDGKVEETWTYWGEDYGHSRRNDNLVTIGNTCFPKEETKQEKTPPKTAQKSETNLAHRPE